MNSVQQPGAVDEYEIQAQQTQNKIERNRGSLGSGFGVLICGFPGAGKTTAAEKIKEAVAKKSGVDVSLVSVDELAAREGVKRVETDTFFTAIVGDYNVGQTNFCVFDSIYSLDEIAFLSKYFDRLGIVYIEANHAARHARLIEDARNGEEDLDEFSHDSLRYRDKQVGKSGLNAIQKANFYDKKIENVGISESEFEQGVRYISQEFYLSYKYDNY